MEVGKSRNKMKIKQLFEMLTSEQRIELADEIRALLEYKDPEPKLTPLCNCFDLDIGNNTPMYNVASIRLINSIRKNSSYISNQGWDFETVREKDLRRIRGIGKETIDEFMRIREIYFVKEVSNRE